MNIYRVSIPTTMFVTVHAEDEDDAFQQALLINEELNNWDYIERLRYLREVEGLNNDFVDGVIYIGKLDPERTDIDIEEEGPVESEKPSTQT